MSAIKDLKVYDVYRREIIGTVEHVASLTGRTIDDVYETIKLAGGLKGRLMELRGDLATAPSPPPTPPPVAQERSEADKWTSPTETAEQQPPPPAASPAAVPETPSPPKEKTAMPEHSRRGKPIEEINAAGKVIGTWPTAGAAERATGVPTNCLAARIRKYGGEYKGRTFRFAGDTLSPSPTKRSRKAIAAANHPSSSPTPPPPPPLLLPHPLPPSSSTDGSLLGIIRNISNTIAGMALGAPGGLLSDVSIGMSSGVSRIEVSVKSVRVQVTPVE